MGGSKPRAGHAGGTVSRGDSLSLHLIHAGTRKVPRPWQPSTVAATRLAACVARLGGYHQESNSPPESSDSTRRSEGHARVPSKYFLVTAASLQPSIEATFCCSRPGCTKPGSPLGAPPLWPPGRHPPAQQRPRGGSRESGQPSPPWAGEFSWMAVSTCLGVVRQWAFLDLKKMCDTIRARREVSETSSRRHLVKAGTRDAGSRTSSARRNRPARTKFVFFLVPRSIKHTVSKPLRFLINRRTKVLLADPQLPHRTRLSCVWATPAASPASESRRS